ncbi:MAG: D-alanyl-D-alanine carboxypeptidase [Clostridia bacterium]|nr:D-alanyl-D-alanine carboxypeptidase [Clostridia bacterium]
MRFFKAFLLFVIVLSVAVCVPAPAAAKTVSSECDISDIEVPIAETSATVDGALDIKARSAILLEPNTLEILYESNADEQLPPASITKIMSLVLIMEAIDRGDFTTEDVVTASEHAASMGGSQIWLEPGEAMTVDDLLKATVIASANDATVALAEKVAGSEEGFVRLMNEKAKALGMENTVFINATGLDAAGHLSTAHDVALMSAELLKHPLIKTYSTVWMDTLRDGESELVNTNKLVRFYEGTTGLKTGTTSGAGYCLAASAERNGLSLVAVIMGGETSAARFEGAKKLLDHGFANFSFETVTADIGENPKISVKGGVLPEAPLIANGTLGVLTEKSRKGDITRITVLPESVSAPVKKGDKVGEIQVFSGETPVGSIDILADADVEKLTFLRALLWLFRGIFKT